MLNLLRVPTLTGYFLTGFCLIACSALSSAQDSAQSEFGPFTADVAAQKFVLHPDLKIELVACEPDVIDPVHIAFDPQGKLWVVEMTDYPNGPEEGQPGLSRIRVLSDDDGDGRFTNPVTFAEKLLFANGLMFWKDGVIVTTDGKIEFMRDTDRDGKVDERQIWFQGFATENPQLRHNHPQFGLDCRIYIANGLRGGEVVPGPDNPWGLNPNSKPLSISGRDFRFDPLTGAYEAIAGMGQFGLTFDRFGNRFVCTNRNPCRQIVLEDEQMTLTPGLRIPRHYEDVAAAGEDSRLFPLSRTWTTSNLHANQFTAACGVLIYNDAALGEQFAGNIFTCDPTANLVHREVPHSIGPTWKSKPGREGVEFLATKDEWFRPVNLSHGPDQSLYVVDMYRAVIEHPQFMPAELKDRPDLTLGTDRGRIWKIVPKDPTRRTPGQLATFDTPTSAQLVNSLAGSSTWEKQHAQRILLEQEPTDVVAAAKAQLKAEKLRGAEYLLPLLATLNSLTVADLQNALANTQTPYLTSQFYELGEQLFSDQPEWKQLVNASLQQAAEQSPTHAQVFAILGRMPWTALTTANQQTVLQHILIKALNDDSAVSAQYDPFWTSTYLRLAARTDSLTVCTQLIAAINRQSASQKEDGEALDAVSLTAIHDLAELVARQNQAGQIQTLLTNVLDPAGASPLTRMSVLAGVSRGIPGGHAALHALVQTLPPAAQSSFAASLTAAGRQLANSQTAASHWEVLFTLVSLADDSESLQQLLEATGSGNATYASLALDALLKRPSAQVDPALVELLGQRRGSVRRGILQAMASRASRVPDLLNEIESGRVPVLEIDATVERLLLRHQDKELLARVKEAIKREPPADRVQVLADYQECLTMKADPVRGRAIFEKNCATCHKVGDVGVNVAPDISDSRTKTPDFYLMNILDPNRAIDANYFSFTALDKEGRVHTGIVAAETSAAVTLKQPEGKTITIARDDIEELKNNGVSLMPVGLERTINKQQMADVISFIKNWRYLDGQIPAEVIK